MQNRIFQNLTTVGAYVMWDGRLAMVVGPDHEGRGLDVVRLGGHVEPGEGPLTALGRELQEEARVAVRLVNAPQTYYKLRWTARARPIVQPVPLPWQPLIVTGTPVRSTALFLAYARSEPQPASETAAILYLRQRDIARICAGGLTLKTFLRQGGRVTCQTPLDESQPLVAGVHLKFLRELVAAGNPLVGDFLCGRLRRSRP